MNDGLVAVRYARALLAFAQQREAVERVHDDVLTLRRALADELAVEGDNGILARCVSSLCDEMQQFLRVVAGNGRADCLDAILRMFIKEYNTLKGITTATLTMASPSPQLEEKLLATLRRRGYTEVDFTSSVNPDLLGGFVLQIEDRRLDASLSTQLKKLRSEFEDKNRRTI